MIAPPTSGSAAKEGIECGWARSGQAWSGSERSGWNSAPTFRVKVLASECTQLCGVRGFEGKASNLGRIQSRGYQPEVVLPARGSLDNVWEHFQLSQPGGERGSGMKLNILQCT